MTTATAATTSGQRTADTPVPAPAVCRSRSRYGRCGLPAGHPPVGHGVPIGGGSWFAYGRPDGRLGYGHLDETTVVLPA